MLKLLRPLFLLAITLCLQYFPVLSQSTVDFIENKGQWPDNVLYKSDIPGGALFLENGCLTYNFFKESDVYRSSIHHHDYHDGHADEDVSPWIVRYHAYKIRFLGANEIPGVVVSERASDYVNYFIGKDQSKWATHVSKYGQVEYTNLWPSIDMKLYSSEFGLKYDVIVKPGGNPASVKLDFDGADHLHIDDGNLHIHTSVNEIRELKPYAYQMVDGFETQVACEFVLNGNILSYDLPLGFDKTRELIIDPQLIFSTYTGSTADNWGFTATPDLYGNVFSGGIVHGIGYPSSTGAFQVNFQGGEAFSSTYYMYGWDVGIIKYSPDGTQRIYATYLGGATSEEMPHSLIVNASNELLVFGTTGSTDFPVSSNAYDQTFNGGTPVNYDNVIKFGNGIDIYVAKISADGDQLLAATYVGGSGNDGFNFKPYFDGNDAVIMGGNDSLYYNYADGARGEIITDAKNNVYIGTTTFSNNFPILNGFQPFSGGKQEGVVFKLDNNLSNLIWSSYFGGTDDDAIYSVDVDEDDDVYVAGGTVSHNFPTTPGTYQQSFVGGTTDGFVAHISANGAQLIASSYIGSNRYDQAYFVRTDRSKNIFVVGQTEANGSEFVYNAGYSVPAGGQFITKFRNNLQSLLWSTMFGNPNSKPDISITAFTVDVCNRVYLSGWGREWPYATIGLDWNSIDGTNSLPTTTGAQQSNTDGQDFYIMVLADDASGIDYATYFGEVHSATVGCGTDHVDGGTSRFDRKGNIYQSVCASCGGCDAFPTTTNAWSTTNNATNCNNAVFRFSFMDDFCVADFDPPPVECAPYTYSFNNTSLYATSYNWDFGDGTTSTQFEPNHQYTESGIYEITLIASNPGTCNLADTIVKQIQILSNSVDTLQQVVICPGDQPQIGVQPSPDPNITYSWSPGTGLSDLNVPNPYASPLSETTYMLVMSNGSCTDTLYQTVNVQDDQLDIVASPDTLVCQGAVIDLSAFSSDSVNSYWWSEFTSFNTLINTDLSSPDVTVTVTQADQFYIRANGPYCGAYDVDTVVVFIRPVGVALNADTTICSGNSIQLQANTTVSGDVLSYSWSPNSTIISGDGTSSPTVQPVSNTTYTVTATNQYGCTTTNNIDIGVDVVQASYTNNADISCYGVCDADVTLQALSGQDPISFTWNNGNQSPFGNNLCAGTYTVTVTDFWGCTSTIGFDITTPDELVTFIADTTGTLCDGSCSGEVVLGTNGGTAPYSYSWITGQSGSNLTGLCAGEYSVTVTDQNGCEDTALAEITDPSDLISTVSTLSDIACFGDCTADVSASANYGTPPYYFYWSTGDSVNLVQDLCAGTYNVTVVDQEQCLRVKYFTIVQPQIIFTSISTPGIPCYGDTANATVYGAGGTGQLSYMWQDQEGNTVSTGTQLGYMPAGTYYVSVTDENGCLKTNQVTLSDPPLLEYTSSVYELLCADACDGIIHMNPYGGTPPYHFNWSNAEYDSVNTDLCSGDYGVTVTDNRGCLVYEDFFVGISDYVPLVDIFADDTLIYVGQHTGLHASSFHRLYNWQPAGSLDYPTSSNPVASPVVTTTYQLNIVDTSGCPAMDSITIYVSDVQCEEPYIYIPNAFTPNSMVEKNRLLKVYSNMVEEIYFAVYDRWGELMYATEDVAVTQVGSGVGWDGTFRGHEVDPAVFVYYVKAICIDKKTFIKKGNVTLIR